MNEFKTYLANLGFNSLETNLVFLEDKTVINTAKSLASVETLIKNTISPIITSGKKISASVLEKAFSDSQKIIKKDLESTYGDNLRRSTDPALKIKNRARAKEIADSYAASYSEYKKQGLTSEEIANKLNYKAELIASTEATRLTSEESDYQLKLKKKDSLYKAVLDRNTCQDCRRNNNKKNANIKLPRHPRCRCFYTYVVKS